MSDDKDPVAHVTEFFRNATTEDLITLHNRTVSRLKEEGVFTEEEAEEMMIK